MEERMLWSLFILCGTPKQEPASIAYDAEQVDLFYSAGQHGNLRWSHLTLRKRGHRIGKGVEQKLNGAER